MLRTVPPDDSPMVAGHNTQTNEAPTNRIVTRRSLAANEGDILSDSSDNKEASVHSDADDRPGNPLDEASVSSDDNDSVVVENLAAENEQRANEQQANDNGSAEDNNNQKTLLEVLRSLEFKYQERESTVGYNWVGTEQRQKSMYLGGKDYDQEFGKRFLRPLVDKKTTIQTIPLRLIRNGMEIGPSTTDNEHVLLPLSMHQQSLVGSEFASVWGCLLNMAKDRTFHNASVYIRRDG